MEENTNIKQHLDDEQLQAVTGGAHVLENPNWYSIDSSHDANLPPDTLERISHHQERAESLFKKSGRIGVSHTQAQKIMKHANSHLDLLNDYNDLFRRYGK